MEKKKVRIDVKKLARRLRGATDHKTKDGKKIKEQVKTTRLGCPRPGCHPSMQMKVRRFGGDSATVPATTILSYAKIFPIPTRRKK